MPPPRKHKRRPRRRGRFAALYKLLAFISIAAALIVGCAVFFRVHDVQVGGNARYTAARIESAAGVDSRDNLITINKYQIAKRLLAELPYIDEVSISRKLPDTLVISVTECIPAAVVEAAGDRWVMDSKGKLLEKASDGVRLPYIPVQGITPLAPAAGTYFAPSERERERLDCLKKLLSALAGQDMLGAVDSIDLSGEYLIEMQYGGQFTVRLAYLADFPYRMRWLKAAVDNESVVEGRPYLVDMTVDGETRFIPI